MRARFRSFQSKPAQRACGQQRCDRGPGGAPLEVPEMGERSEDTHTHRLGNEREAKKTNASCHEKKTDRKSGSKLAGGGVSYPPWQWGSSPRRTKGLDWKSRGGIIALSSLQIRSSLFA